VSKKDDKVENMLVRGEYLDQLLTLAGEVIIISSNQGILTRNLQASHDRKYVIDDEILRTSKDLSSTTSVLSSSLHHLVQSIRTVDLKDLSFRARRLVRNTSRQTGKPICFQVKGEETLVDKSIVEKLYDPISHQIRNAIDHGIEDVQTRKQQNKPEEGTIDLKIHNTEKNTVIEISDDGAGIDMVLLKKKAVAKGIIRDEEIMTEDLALRCMCAPGFSTSDEVSEISGRGVGMDVVKNHIDDLGGTISFTTCPCKGTTFIFRIPLLSAVNIVDALVVKAGNTIFGFPIANVLASLSVPVEKVITAFNRGEVFEYLEQVLPIYDLYGVISKNEAKKDRSKQETVSILVIEHKSKRAAFVVSEFLAPQKLVIIPFEQSMSVDGLVGTTILGGGKLGFIIDVPALLNLTFGYTGKKVDPEILGGTLGELEEVPAKEIPEEISHKDSEIQDADGEEVKDDEVFRQEFVGELQKLCSELNESVFDLESDPSDKDKMNAAFRLFHTIKGNLIMMGLPQGGETVHGVESVLDHVRSHDLEMTSEIMDIIMDGVSYIENISQQSKLGSIQDAPSEDILERSTSFLPKVTYEQEDITNVLSAEIKVSPESSYRALNYRQANKSFYRMYVEFDSELQPSFLIACLIYKRMCDVGDVIGTVPFWGDVEKGMMDGKLKVLFVSDWKLEDLEKSLKDILIKHYGASLVKLTSVVY